GQATVISPNHICPSALAEVIATIVALSKPKKVMPLNPTLLASALNRPKHTI
ncbi:MAG: hypothetical protein ACI9S7_001677, partial [Candidatus Paceibacteria bacterium]